MARIMCIHHAPSIGGGSISFQDILDMLTSEHEVIACCPSIPRDLINTLKGKGYNTIALNLPIPTYNHYNGGHSMLTRTFWLGIYNYFKYHKEWEVFLASHNPDIVMVNSSVMSLLGPIIERTGAKAICFVRETFPKWSYFKTKTMQKLLSTWFDGVLFLSNYDKDASGFCGPTLGVIRDCIKDDFYQDLSRDEACAKLHLPVDDYHVLYVGGFSWLKGLDVALKSLLYIENENINLVIAGDMSSCERSAKWSLRSVLNPRRFMFANKIKSLLIPNRSRRLSIIGVQENMAYSYAASDVVIFPSNLPHQARPVFEAGVYSLPIIISDFTQTSEYVKNKSNGLTFKPGSARDLARAIELLYHDRFLAKSLGHENCQKAIELHNYETEKAKLLQFVDSILQK